MLAAPSILQQEEQFLFSLKKDKSWNRKVAINRFRSKWDAQLSLQVPQRKAEMHREDPNQPFLPGKKIYIQFLSEFFWEG